MKSPGNVDTRVLTEQIGRSIAAQIVEQINREGTRLAPEYLTPSQASQLTGFSTKALEAMRSRRDGPAYLKVGTSVRYRVSDLRAWIEGGAP